MYQMQDRSIQVTEELLNFKEVVDPRVFKQVFCFVPRDELWCIKLHFTQLNSAIPSQM